MTAHRGGHLEDALESVLRQTVSTFDIILAADSFGEPEVLDIFGAFAAQLDPPRVTVLSERGGSAGPVRNAGMRAASTEWVTYLDGDDVLAPYAIATLLGAISDDNADILSTGLWHIGSEGTRLETPESLGYMPSLTLYTQDPEVHGVSAHLFQLFAIRRRLWARYPYYSGGPGGDDLDFVLHQLLVGRFKKVPAYCYGHRRTLDGFSARGPRRAAMPGSCTCPCSRRYADGYYARLLAAAEDVPAGNFLDPRLT